MPKFPISPDPVKTIESALDAGVKSTPTIVAQLQASQGSKKPLEHWVEKVEEVKNSYSPATADGASPETNDGQAETLTDESSERANEQSVTDAKLREALKAANVEGEKAGELPP